MACMYAPCSRESLNVQLAGPAYIQRCDVNRVPIETAGAPPKAKNIVIIGNGIHCLAYSCNHPTKQSCVDCYAALLPRV